MVQEACDIFNRGDGVPAMTIDCDHTDDFERALRTAFEDVRFVETDWEPGVIIN